MLNNADILVFVLFFLIVISFSLFKGRKEKSGEDYFLAGRGLSRWLMSVYMMIIYVAVTISAVLYSCGLTIHTIFEVDLTTSVWIIGIIAMIYTTYGGLKSVVWADLFQGFALIAGGSIILFAALNAVGGWETFISANRDKLHLALPSEHPELPWTALMLGIWIPNIYC